ncbi:MAG: glycerol-3-phosphate 1-O-acyltransferase PlsY [Gemmataceae bacterium]
MPYLNETLVIVAAYLIGAIPFGYAVARAHGVDIFQAGSGNIGATNVGRVLGRKWGILVFFLDFAKGAVPAAVARALEPTLASTGLAANTLPVLAGLAAFVGHLFPVYLRFRGGKGVATGAGVISVLLPIPFACALIAWIVAVGSSGYVSLASLVAVSVLCLSRLLFAAAPFAADNVFLTAFCFVTAALVFLRHRANIGRLLHGTESQAKWVPVMIFSKTAHVLALGLWFGSLTFFTFVVALVTFHTFEAMGANPEAVERQFLPLTSDFNKAMGTRLAGAVVGPIFPYLFLLEGVCGFIVVYTALPWARRFPDERVHHWRWLLAALALCTVLAGWPLVEKVAALRLLRYGSDLAVATQAEADFHTWHLVSLLLNFVTWFLVTAVMAMAAKLPAGEGTQPAS